MEIRGDRILVLKKFAILFLLFLAAFLERTVFDFGPNIELITVVMLLTAAYFGYKESLFITAALLFSTDLIITNSSIFLFTWTGFLIPALSAHKFMQNNKTVSAVTTGLGANIFFYLWTNFGVWLISGMYKHTLTGLMASYINSLPFLRMQMISTLMFVPAAFFIAELVLSKKHLLYSNYERIGSN